MIEADANERSGAAGGTGDGIEFGGRPCARFLDEHIALPAAAAAAAIGAS